MSNSAPQSNSDSDSAGPSGKRVFRIELIKPSHYDDDGYVIQWIRSYIPSNSLSSVYGLTRACVDSGALGDGVAVEVRAYDETNTVLPIRDIVRRLKRNGGQSLVCMIGVQSNQFPRAMDIAREFRNEGIQVAIGGFHVSGCIAMLPSLPADIQAALDMGVSLFAGEAEGRLQQVYRDAMRGELAPIYNYMHDLPEMTDQPTPYLPADLIRKYGSSRGCFDAGRGCPFTCSFCTIINVQGRKSRYRGPDDVERLIREHAAEGVKRFFITDDNFARNKNWEPIFDRIIELKEQHGFKVSFLIQVDTLCHKIPNFVEKAARAGCKQVFIGLEN
ncbi:MAG: radical SAM protein, partial [Gammaproteobacteria bacterium]|nr:radical SAM protein [Gammaproteobacteria bacterium]